MPSHRRQLPCQAPVRLLFFQAMKALDPVGDASYSLITRNLWKDTPGEIFFLLLELSPACAQTASSRAWNRIILFCDLRPSAGRRV